MKKLLFFCCALAMLWGTCIHAMDASVLKNQIETHQWDAIATALADNTISAAEIAPYPKEAFDTKNQERHDFFTTLIRHASKHLTYSQYGFKNTDKSNRIWKAIELLILMEKITHDQTIITNNIISPYSNWNSNTFREEISKLCIRWYTNCINNVKNHKTAINMHASSASWQNLVSHIYTENVDPLYLMGLTNEQRTALQTELETQSMRESCPDRKKFLTELNDQLAHIPHLPVKLPHSHTLISFAHAYRSYLVGGVALAAALALIYRYYRSCEVHGNEENEVDDTDELTHPLI